MILSILLVSLVIFAGFGNAEKPYPDPLVKVKFSGAAAGGARATGTGVVAGDAEDIPMRSKTPRPLSSRPNSEGGTESDSSNSSSNTSDGGSQTPKNQGNSRLWVSPRSKTREDTVGANGSSSSGTKENAGASIPAKSTEGGSQTPDSNSNQGDSRLGLSPRSKGRGGGQDSTNSSSAVTSSTGGSPSDTVPDACSADKVPFSCYDQGKLKDYCTQNFGTAQVASGNLASAMKRYVVDTTKKANWYEAVGLCLSRNMSLATVESFDDQKALSEVMNNAELQGRVQNAWLSATDLGQTNHYVWMSTGQPVTWANWYNGEPNHKINGNQTEHCVEVINFRWKWNDNLCDNQEFFVCQYYSDN